MEEKMMKWPFISAEKLYLNVTDGTHDSPKAQSTGFPLVTSKNIKGGVLDLSTASLISKEDYESINKRSQVEKWDVIISMIGEYCGYTYIEKNDNIIYAVKNVGLFKTKSKIEANWLTYYLQSDHGRHYLGQAKSGSSQPYLSLGALRQLPILNPDQSVKEKIAKVLSELDAKIELNNRINAELEEMAKLVYAYWFLQFDFPISPEQTEKMGEPTLVGKPYKSSGGKMVWDEALNREIPEGWRSGNLSDLGKIIGGSTPSRNNPEYFSENGIPWITPKDLSNNVGNKFIFKGELDVSEKGKESASLNLMPRGTILMSSRAPIGYLAISISDVTTNQGFKSIVPVLPFTTEFIYYKINEMLPVIENNASGSTFKEVSGSTLKLIKIVIPSDGAIEAFTQKVSPIFEKQENLQKQNQQLSKLRDWLLPMLMNGQVSVAAAEERVEEELGMVAEKLGMVAEERAKYDTIKK